MEIHEMAGHVIRRLHQVSAQVFAAKTQEAGFDLTPVQFAAMGAIKDNPGIDQAGVAALIAYDRATIGGVIDRLEKKGLVERSINRRDRRAREVRLSTEGARTIEAMFPLVRDLQKDILRGLDDDERQSFLVLAAKAMKASSESGET